MKKKEEVQQVVERYINSKNEEFVNDYVKMMQYLQSQPLDEEVAAEMRMKVVGHFLQVINKNKLRLVDVCATRDKRVSAEVLALLDGWLATTDNTYKERALALIAYQKDPITIAFLHGVVEWKSREYNKLQLQKKMLTQTVTDFKVETLSDKAKRALQAIEEYDKMFNEAERMEDAAQALQMIAERYISIAQPFAKELNDDDELKTKEKKFIYSKLSDHHRERVEDYFKCLEDYSVYNPKYTTYLTDLYRNFTNDVKELTSTDEVADVQNTYIQAIQFRWALWLIDNASRVEYMNKIVNYTPTHIYKQEFVEELEYSYS